MNKAKPTPPLEPKRPTHADFEHEFIQVQSYTVEEGKQLELVDNNCETLVKLEVDYSYGDPNTYTLHVGRYPLGEEIDAKLDQAMTLYHRSMEQYRKKMDAYEQELAAWEGEQRVELRVRLDEAEKLLREHGRIK